MSSFEKLHKKRCQQCIVFVGDKLPFFAFFFVLFSFHLNLGALSRDMAINFSHSSLRIEKKFNFRTQDISESTVFRWTRNMILILCHKFRWLIVLFHRWSQWAFAESRSLEGEGSGIGEVIKLFLCGFLFILSWTLSRTNLNSVGRRRSLIGRSVMEKFSREFGLITMICSRSFSAEWCTLGHLEMGQIGLAFKAIG